MAIVRRIRTWIVRVWGQLIDQCATWANPSHFLFIFVLFKQHCAVKIWRLWAVVVAQLVDRLLPTQEICSSSRVISKFYLLSTMIKTVYFCRIKTWIFGVEDYHTHHHCHVCFQLRLRHIGWWTCGVVSCSIYPKQVKIINYEKCIW